MDFLWTVDNPQGKDSMMFYGFGPMLKYSKWDLGVKVNNKVESYSASDISVGAVIDFGFAHRFGNMALRGEFQYYWEKVQYIGIGLALQFPF
jgi:hypothetical protein